MLLDLDLLLDMLELSKKNLLLLSMLPLGMHLVMLLDLDLDLPILNLLLKQRGLLLLMPLPSLLGIELDQKVLNLP